MYLSGWNNLTIEGYMAVYQPSKDNTPARLGFYGKITPGDDLTEKAGCSYEVESLDKEITY